MYNGPKFSSHLPPPRCMMRRNGEGFPGDSTRTWQQDWSSVPLEYRRRTRLHFGVGTLYDDNSERDITARSLAIFSVGEEPRCKICVWRLILHPLHACLLEAAAAAAAPKRKNPHEENKAKDWRARVSSDAREYIVIAATAFPRCSSSFSPRSYDYYCGRAG